MIGALGGKDSKHKLAITPQSHVASAQEQIEKNYFMHNIIERLY